MYLLFSCRSFSDRSPGISLKTMTKIKSMRRWQGCYRLLRPTRQQRRAPASHSNGRSPGISLKNLEKNKVDATVASKPTVTHRLLAVTREQNIERLKLSRAVARHQFENYNKNEVDATVARMLPTAATYSAAAENASQSL